MELRTQQPQQLLHRLGGARRGQSRGRGAVVARAPAVEGYRGSECTIHASQQWGEDAGGLPTGGYSGGEGHGLRWEGGVGVSPWE